MSLMLCDGCGRFVDTDYETGEYFAVALGAEDDMWLCERCSEKNNDAEHNLFLQNMQQQTENKQ